MSLQTYRLAFPDHENQSYAHVSYGIPFTETCPKHISETFNSKRAYIVASASLCKHTTHVSDLKRALNPNYVGTWVGIRPHTPFDDLVPIINDMREKQADSLITLGGGSLTDGAKLISYALVNGVKTVEDLEEMMAQTKRDKDADVKHFRDRSSAGNDPAVPIICIPTTLSAGEYSKFGGGTSSKTHLKSIMTHPKMFPSLVILDPALCTTTPEWVWLSTGVRAIDHCVEGMASLQSIDEVDLAAEKSLGLLIPNLLRTKADPNDLEARFSCQLAANYTILMLFWMPKIFIAGASHGIGHQLGPLGVGHGQTSCILLPAVLKYNKKANANRQDKVKKIIWSDAGVSEILRKAGLAPESSDASDALDVVFHALGMPRSLEEVGVGRDKFDLLATNSLLDPCCAVNAIPLTEKKQVLEILEMVAVRTAYVRDRKRQPDALRR